MSTPFGIDQKNLLERFVRYAAIGTQSNRRRAEEKTPSTDCQWNLIRLLERECRALGFDSVLVTAEGFLIARLASNLPPERGNAPPCIGFMAHVDTASDAPGSPVSPRVHENYSGGIIVLSGGVQIDPADNPSLARYKGETIITSDGTTLLGADDKAGVAAIMSAAEYLIAHPEIPHGELECIFTPDEETGLGMNRFPLDTIHSKAAYTLDGDGEGTVEAECFTAWKAEARFTGKVIHIGHARGKLANAVAMAARFVDMLPRSESPEATDGSFGYYCPMDIKGNLEEAVAGIFLRDFDEGEIRRRLEALKAFAAAVEAAFPGGKVSIREEEQYRNMKSAFARDPRILEYAYRAVRETGMEPIRKSIRGGTDGARLSEKGVPTPNIFMGGENFHARTEWVSLPAMARAAQTVVRLARIWAGA
ncbi:MAG: peptidase T [Spirochaetales bacterium]|jgi:tripeptide aminopeptidase|nr:peptidase T [Spirochaetales bacterium]